MTATECPTLEDVICFARQRHVAWEGWYVTSPIIRTRKFTNVFRILDRGSQYLLRLMDHLDETPDRLALAYAYRQINRPDTFDEIILENGGNIPRFDQITSAEWVRDVVWPVIKRRSGQFLNSAYMILIRAGDARPLHVKMATAFPCARPFLEAASHAHCLEDRVRLLKDTPGLGPFLSMQMATDLGYCRGEPDQENQYILAGPGSRKGVALISDDKPEDVLRSFPVGELPTLPGSGGRPASLMDIQNVFCEFSKYWRYVLKEREGRLPKRSDYERGRPFPVIIPEQFKR